MKTIARFEIAYEQIIDPEGHSVGKRLPAFARDHDELKKMYRAMSLTRAFDKRAIALQRTGKLGTYASCLGHEAAHVGTGSAMRPDDVLAPSYREYGAQLWRGVTLDEVLFYWGGDERGNDFSVPRQDFAWSVPIATQALYGAGAALAFKTRKEQRAVIAMLGDGGTSEGAFSEAMNVAGAMQLPIVFVVVNNQWAISVPLHAQTRAQTLAQKAVGSGIPGIQVDGNDVIAVRKVVEDALELARSGKGPTLVEALTYRLSDHTTADDARRYRNQEEVDKALELEPLIRFSKYLQSLGIWDEQQEEALAVENKALIDAAIKKYETSERQPVSSMFDYMFEELPEALLEQREIAVSEERTHD